MNTSLRLAAYTGSVVAAGLWTLAMVQAISSTSGLVPAAAMTGQQLGGLLLLVLLAAAAAGVMFTEFARRIFTGIWRRDDRFNNRASLAAVGLFASSLIAGGIVGAGLFAMAAVSLWPLVDQARTFIRDIRVDRAD